LLSPAIAEGAIHTSNSPGSARRARSGP
jgi:hypothetical protein